MKIQTKTGAVIAAGSLKQNDPVDYRTVGSGNTPLATFGLMVDRKKSPDGSSSVEWLNCKAWRSMATKAAACPGGADVLVAGHMEEESWQGRDGEQHTRQVCVCEFIAMATFAASSVPFAETKQPKPRDVVFEELNGDDGELPF